MWKVIPVKHKTIPFPMANKPTISPTITITMAILDGETIHPTSLSMFMTTAGAGVGTTHGYGTLAGAGTPAGAGTILGDGTAGAGEALVGAGMLAGVGTTLGYGTAAGAGTLAGAGEALVGDGTLAGAGADIGTNPSLEEDIMAEITLVSQADAGIPTCLELPSPLVPTDAIPMDLDITVDVPTEPLDVVITWQVEVPVVTVIAPM